MSVVPYGTLTGRGSALNAFLQQRLSAGTDR
jgi:hypothetical protein